MKFLVAFSLFVSVSLAAPKYYPIGKSEPCLHDLVPAVPAPARLVYPMPQPLEVRQLEYDFPGMITAPLPAPVEIVAPPRALPVPIPAPVPVAPKIEYDFPAPIVAPAPAPAPAPAVVPAPARIVAPAPAPVPIQPKIEYDFPAPIIAPAPAPVAPAAPVQIAVPAPVKAIAPAPVPVAVPAPAIAVVPQAVETRVHYAETPVVVGQSTQILKPNLGAVGVVSKTGEIVSKEKVLAPVRTVSDITPQVTVQHPTKVNVQKVAVDVPVAAPYAQPVPVPVAPQYEIHQIHTPAIQRVQTLPSQIEMIGGVPCINGVPIQY